MGWWLDSLGIDENAKEKVRLEFVRWGASGGSKNKGRTGTWLTKLGVQGMQRRWKRKRFAKDIILEALSLGQDLTGPQLMSMCKAEGSPIKRERFHRIMVELRIKSKDGAYSMGQKNTQK